jgi:hypothetical protein
MYALRRQTHPKNCQRINIMKIVKFKSNYVSFRLFETDP